MMGLSKQAQGSCRRHKRSTRGQYQSSVGISTVMSSSRPSRARAISSYVSPAALLLPSLSAASTVACTCSSLHPGCTRSVLMMPIMGPPESQQSCSRQRLTQEY